MKRVAQAPEPVRVRFSSIHGRGVFAAKPIRPGTRVIEYKGTVRPWSSYKASYRLRTNLMLIDHDLVIDPRHNGNRARFINHSCNPNCEAVVSGKRVFIYATRPIRRGEELTYDYQLTLSRQTVASDHRRHRCRCGAPNCTRSMLKRPRRRRS